MRESAGATPAAHAARAAACPECALREGCALRRLGGDASGVFGLQITERVFHRGDVIADEGKRAGFVRVVKMGTAFGYRRGQDGGQRPIGIVGRGTAFGLFGVFDSPNQASVVAVTTVRVCELPVFALRSAGACSGQLMAQIGRSVAELFAAVTAWSEAMRLPGVVNQLAYMLVLLADASHAAVVELPSHAALAELLGTRRETVARALATLEGEGVLRRHERRRCEVQRSRLLARLVQGVR